MALSYPLAFPTIKKPRRQRFIAQSVNAQSVSPFTLASQTFSHPGQRWRCEIELAPTTDIAVAETWVAFLLSLNGRQGTFRMGDLNRTSPRGTVSAATITGVAGSQSPTITMTGTLLTGDYIQLGSGFPNHKLHKVLQDRSGTGVIEIWPALRQDYTGGAVVWSSASGIWRLDQNEFDWSIDRIMYEGLVFNAVEAL